MKNESEIEEMIKKTDSEKAELIKILSDYKSKFQSLKQQMDELGNIIIQLSSQLDSKNSVLDALKQIADKK